MKKTLILVLALMLFSLSSVVAQETTTWINPNDGMAFFPASMPGWVTNGFYYDEWDILLRSPGELSNYEGYSVLTAYGNYEAKNGVNFVNPFATNALSNSGGNLGIFTLGYIMPFMDFRAGVIGGFDPGEPDDGLNVAAAGPFASGSAGDAFEWDETVQDVTATGGNINEIDWTENWTAVFRNTTQSSSYIVGAGIDLNFLGASVFALINNTTYSLGGAYTYTFTQGADTVIGTTPAGDKVMSRTVYTGLGKEGKAKAYPAGGGGNIIGAVVELPLNLGDLLLPVTANGMFGLVPAGPPAIGQEPVNVAISTTNVGGALAATNVNSLTMLYGDDLANYTGDALNLVNSGDAGDDTTLTTGALQGLAQAVPGLGWAYDPDESKGGSVLIGVGGDIQPFITQSDNFTVKTKAGLDFSIDTGNTTEAGEKSATLSYNDGDAANDTYTYTATRIAPSSSTTTTLDGEFGGALQFTSSDGVVSVGTGLFYTPTFETVSVTRKDPTVVTQSGVYTDGAAAVTDATFATGLAPAIAGIDAGTIRGTWTTVDTTTVVGKDVVTTIDHVLQIPASAKVKIEKAKMELFGGYILSRNFSTIRTITPTTITDPTETFIYNAAGTLVNDDGVDPLNPPATVALDEDDTDVAITTENQAAAINTPGEWTGQMDWLLRWMPHESLTIDIFGQTAMTALNFGLFGGGAGFNANAFISSLGMSVSFNIK